MDFGKSCVRGGVTVLRSVWVLLIVAAVLAAAAWPGNALAVSGIWSATPTDANWIPEQLGTANWMEGVDLFPGDISGSTTNMDVATFNSGSSQTTIAINSDRP